MGKILPRLHPATRKPIPLDLARQRSPEGSEQYKAFIRSKPCCHCTIRAFPRDAHHVGGDRMGGTALKTDDYRTVPLCRICHDELHANIDGELEFWGEHTHRELHLNMARCLFEFFSIEANVSGITDD